MEKDIFEPVRVLHMLYSMNRGGAETFIMNYYRKVEREKLQFDFLISSPDKCDYEDEILKMGGRIFRVPILSKNPFLYIIEVNSFFKKHKEYEIIHAHTSAKNAIPLYLAKRNNIRHRICHSHMTKNDKGINGFIKNMLKPFVKYVSTDFVACGKEAGIWLYGQKFYNNHGMLLRNVIDAEKYRYNVHNRRCLREQNKWTDKIIIGNIARFDIPKNHEYLIDIFFSIKKRKSDAILVLVGDGPLRESIVKKVETLGLSESVFFTGVVDNVQDYMQAIDAFLLPSLYEGLPLTLIEAQSAGLRCFTSKDVVTNESNISGLVEFISLADNSEQWAEKILSFMPYQRQDMYQVIIDSGYDVISAAIFLQNFYLSKLEKTLK